MVTFYDVPRMRNLLHVGERSRRAVLRSRSAVKSVLRISLWRFRIWNVGVHEVHHELG